jgi:Polyketide cyclase / dehydrase and lipid transport
MQTLDTDQVSRTIAATPAELYAIVSDVTRTPELSPEIVKAEWVGDGGPFVGARFRATNKVSRGPSWTNEPEVLVADPGREFAFVRREKTAGHVEWRYRFEPVEGGTRVTESYEVTKQIPWIGWVIITYAFGSKDRRAELRAGMEQTLRRLDEVGTLSSCREPVAKRDSSPSR